MASLNCLSRTEIEKLVDEWIHNQRNREVCLRRFIDGIVYEQLAEEFSLSVTQIKKICYKGKRIILTHL
jgi:DNA-directed RNA polymerase specialized sigma24 family protein